MKNGTQVARGHDVPVEADSVDSPILHYGDPVTAVHFLTEDGRWSRVTFERLDSLRVSRGEHHPFPLHPDDEDEFHWVTTVSNSEWLRERYEYERRNYESSYNFGGAVEEMLEEFSHYVFSFHDEFVEAIAAGIWFEVEESLLVDRPIGHGHPLKGLTHLEPVEEFESSGIRCSVRRNPMGSADLDGAAALCSQTVLEVGAELDGGYSPSWFLTRRVRNGVGLSYLRNYFGNKVDTYSGIPSLQELRPHIDRWLAEVRDRRRQMGKS